MLKLKNQEEISIFMNALVLSAPCACVHVHAFQFEYMVTLCGFVNERESSPTEKEVV